MPHLEVNPKWCKGCAVCVVLCPKKVLEIQGTKVSVVNPEACIGCKICEHHCPDMAIFVKDGGKK